MTTDGELSSRNDVWQLLNGYTRSRAVQVVAILGVADLLVDGPKTVDELARATRTHADTLGRLLRAVASIGVFTEHAGGRFGLTPRAEYLRSDVPGSLRVWATLVGGRSFWASWGGLLESVQTGETAFPKLHGMTNWEFRERHPDEGAVFDAAMTDRSAASVAAIVDAYDFSQFRVLADVGGGHGVLLAAILAANPSLFGILFDQPHVVRGADPVLQQAHVADRCRVISGDFFDSLPKGASAYLLKSVLHDWDDQHALRLLRNCRTAIQPDAKLLVVEPVIWPNDPQTELLFSDLLMLVMNGGRERTADDYLRLFAAAGIRLCEIVRTRSAGCIIEGVAAW